MISNQILQTTVDGLKAISRVDFCVIDADGKVAAKTFEDGGNLGLNGNSILSKTTIISRMIRR